MTKKTDRTHTYHAEAHILSGKLDHPVAQPIDKQSHVKLNQTEPGYFLERSEIFRVQGVVSYSGGYTQVTGNPDPKEGHGWATLSTSVIEGLNILEVLTADRVVAQIGTEYPLEGYTPAITFLGTRFENLRIAGYPIEVELDLDFFGAKPDGDVPYARHKPFLHRLQSQHQALQQYTGLPKAILDRYNRDTAKDGDLAAIEGSLVKRIEGNFPGTVCGHILDIPNFGKVSLATVRIEHDDVHAKTGNPKKTTIHLNMFEVEMGCIGTGSLAVGGTKTNGQTDP